MKGKKGEQYTNL